MITDKNLKEARDLYIEVLQKKIEILNALEGLDVLTLHLDLRDSGTVRSLIKEKIKANEIGVYAIFTNSEKINDIKQALTEFRNEQNKNDDKKKKKQRIPRPNHNAKSLEGCIYVGKSGGKGGLGKRISQHLIGTSVWATSALKCNLWLERTSTHHVRIDYIKIERAQLDLIRDLEKALWNYYEPAIGAL